MKATLTLISFLITSIILGQTTLDSLNTNKAVAKFLTKHVNTNYNYLYIFNRKETPYMVHKVDLDKNNRTDLVIESYTQPYHLVILDLGNQVYKMLEFEEKLEYLNLAELDTIIRNDHLTKLVYKTPIYKDDLDYILLDQDLISNSNKSESDISFYKMDTLVIKYGELFHYNPKPKAELSLKEITLQFLDCYWACPEFKMTINSKGNLTYKNENRSFETKLSVYKMIDLKRSLAYIDLDKVSRQGSNVVRDGQNFNLTFLFDNEKISFNNSTGQIKQHEIYPVYKKIMAIRNTLLKAHDSNVPDHNQIFWDATEAQ